MRPEVKAGFVIGLCCLAGGLFWAINGTRNAATTEIPFDVLPPGDDSANTAFLTGDITLLGGRSGRLASNESESTTPGNDGGTEETRAATAAESPKGVLTVGAAADPQPSGAATEPGAVSRDPISSASDDLGEDVSSGVEYPGGDLSLSRARRPASVGSDEEVLEARRGGAASSDLARPGSEGTTMPGSAIEQSPAPRRDLGDRVRSLTGASTYEIQDGDNYTSIAREKYGHDKYWQLIQQANPEYDPNRLPIGKPLKLPSKDEFDKRMSRKAGAADKKKTIAADAQRRAGRATYVVAEGDTLTEIATNVLKDANRWPEIYELNRDRLESPDLLPEGIELRMPPLDSVKKP